MSQLPSMSVIIVTRNRARTLKRTIDRLLLDDYPNREIVVWDGLSTDGTVELLKSYDQSVVRWTSGKDYGEYDAFNKAIALSTGEVLKWLPDDDELRPGALLKAGEWLHAHPDIDILFGQTAVWEDHGEQSVLLRTTNQTEPLFGPQDWLRHRSGVYSIASFVRRRAFDRVGQFSTRFVCGDTEYWIRAAQAGVHFGLMADVVVDYHLTGDNGITRYSKQIAKDLVRIAIERGTLADIVFMTTWKGPVALGIEPQLQEVFKLAEQYNVHPFRIARAKWAERQAARPIVNPRSKKQ